MKKSHDLRLKVGNLIQKHLTIFFLFMTVMVFYKLFTKTICVCAHMRFLQNLWLLQKKGWVKARQKLQFMTLSCETFFPKNKIIYFTTNYNSISKCCGFAKVGFIIKICNFNLKRNNFAIKLWVLQSKHAFLEMLTI